MAETVKRTVQAQSDGTSSVVATQTKVAVGPTQTTEYLIYFLLGVLEVFLVFRLILKITGASTASGFVKFIYSITSLFVLPFEGIFRKAVAQGVETAAVFEPSTLVAIIVYGLLAWGLVVLLRILSGEKPPTEVSIN